jgi:hypothetical protein
VRNKVFKIILLLGAMIGIAVGVSFLFPATPPPVLKPLPNPNGYDSLVEAGRRLPRNIPGVDKFTPAELSLLLESNSNALCLARSGLAMECRAPLQFSHHYLTNHIHEITPFRALGQLFVAEGRLAEFENRTTNAASAYLDTIQLGLETGRGGLIIDTMIGTGIQSLGASRLKMLGRRLDAESSRQSAMRLESLDAGAESWKEVIEREDEWVANYPVSFRERIASFVLSRASKSPLKKAELRFNELQAERRKLMIQLAARAYELEKGTPPKRISDLVPAYLKTIPLDPITRTNIAYQF